MDNCFILPYSKMLFFLFCFVAEVYSREVCSTSFDGTYYCDDGWYCCGSRTCCKRSTTVTSLSGGVIAGIVIGSLVGGAFLIAICRAACRQCNKDKQQVRQITYPHTSPPHTGVQFVSSGQVVTPQTSYGQPFPGQPLPGQQLQAPPPTYAKYP